MKIKHIGIAIAGVFCLSSVVLSGIAIGDSFKDNSIKGEQGEPGKDGHTPKVEVGSNGNWWIDGVDTGVQASGKNGQDGEDGNSIVSIAKTNSSGNVDTYTITFSDGSTSEFTVTNGTNGIQGIQGVPGKDGVTPEVKIGENGHWIINGIDSGVNATGPEGKPGEDGRGIASIKLSTTKDNVDTYEITYTDGTKDYFIVRNGVDGKPGEQGPQGLPGQDGHTPVIGIGDNGNWIIDGIDSKIPATGPKGDKGEQGEQGVPGKDGRGIVSILKTASDGGVDTYTITYTDGTVDKFIVTNGKDGQDGEDGKQGAQGLPGKDGRTPVIGIGENGNWIIDGVDSGVKAQGPKGDKGDQGEPGKDGRSVVSIEKTKSIGMIDTYEITYSDGTKDYFTVTNGKDGVEGKPGEQGIQGIPGKDGETPTIEIGESGTWIINGVDSKIPATGPKGDKGDQGDPGKDGKGIISIQFTSSKGNVDIYTITYTDGTTSIFNVTNGVDGTPGKDGINGEPGKDGHTPKITIGENGNWFVDNNDTNIKAQGPQGPIGPQGPQGDKGEQGEKGDQGDKGDKGDKGDPGKDGRSIVSIVKTDTKGNIDTYTITYSDNTVDTFLVTNGEDGKPGEQGPQGIPGKDGHTPTIGIGENGTWIIDGVDSKIPATGPKGDPGKDGKGIVSIEKTDTSHNVDTYTITFTDGTTSKFQVTNGVDGKDGIQGVQGLPGKDGHTPVVEIGINGNWFIDKKDSGIKAQGPKGDKGDPGKDGRSIVSIVKTGTSGNVDTYTITYSDNTTDTFIITNGEDGKPGEQGPQGIPGKDGVAPKVEIGSNGNWFINNVDSGKKAVANDGESAYEIYIKHHPEYKGTEEQWIEDVINGNLKEKMTVTFNTNGGSSIDTQTISYGTYAKKPTENPTKPGYIFDGWYLNGEVCVFNQTRIFENVTIEARWIKEDIKVTLDSLGGEIANDTIDIKVGQKYELPTPTKSNYIFDGWYLGDTKVPEVGVWNISKEDTNLTAKWVGEEVVIRYQYDPNLGFDCSQTTIIEYGKKFRLPIPSIKTGETFVGWGYANGNLITDSQGKSLSECKFVRSEKLQAVYYVEVYSSTTLGELVSKSDNDILLKRQYVLMNDIKLDYGGTISKFQGTIDGNGHSIDLNGKKLLENVGFNKLSKCRIKNLKLIGSGQFLSGVQDLYSLDIHNIEGEAILENIGNFAKKERILNMTIKDAENINVKFGYFKNVNFDNIGSLKAERNSEIGPQFDDYKKYYIESDKYFDQNVTFNKCYFPNEASYNFEVFKVNDIYNICKLKYTNCIAYHTNNPLFNNYAPFNKTTDDFKLQHNHIMVENFVLTGHCTYFYKDYYGIPDYENSEKIKIKNFLAIGEVSFKSLVEGNIIENYYTTNKSGNDAGVGQIVIDDPSKITGEFIENNLHFNSAIWNLIDIDIPSRKYPSLKHGKFIDEENLIY